MYNRGFTLVELVVTIALLSIILIISFVSINGVVKQSKVNDCENLVSNIKSAAKEYVSDNRYNLSSNGDLNITALDLVSNNYLSSPIVNPFNNENIVASSINIRIELMDDYSARNVEVRNGSNKIVCDNGIW